MKSYAVHYKNKYPFGRVDWDENSLDAYDREGELRVSLRKNGSGQIADVGAEMGASDRHDLSPIPKETRCWKLFKDGRIGKAEEYDERVANVKDLDRVPSEEEIAKQKAEKSA